MSTLFTCIRLAKQDKYVTFYLNTVTDFDDTGNTRCGLFRMQLFLKDRPYLHTEVLFDTLMYWTRMLTHSETDNT